MYAADMYCFIAELVVYDAYSTTQCYWRQNTLCTSNANKWPATGLFVYTGLPIARVSLINQLAEIGDIRGETNWWCRICTNLLITTYETNIHVIYVYPHTYKYKVDHHWYQYPGAFNANRNTNTGYKNQTPKWYTSKRLFLIFWRIIWKLHIHVWPLDQYNKSPVTVSTIIFEWGLDSYCQSDQC